MNEECLINQKQIEALKELSSPDEPSLLVELIDLFLSDSKNTLMHLKSAIDSDDFNKIEKYAHKLKGSCANLGADSLKNLCQQIEDESYVGNKERMVELLKKVEMIYEKVLKKLNEIKKSSI